MNQNDFLLLNELIQKHPVIRQLVTENDRLKRKKANQRRELKRLIQKQKFIMATAQFPTSSPEMPIVEELQYRLKLARTALVNSAQTVEHLTKRLEARELPVVAHETQASEA